MQRLLLATCAITTTLGLSVQAFAAERCAHPYSRAYPFSLPVSADKASVYVQSTVSFDYDCSSAQARSSSSAGASFLKLDMNFLSVDSLAYSEINAGQTSGSIGQTRVVVLGREVVNEQYDLQTAVDFDPTQDIDVGASMFFPVGPLPVPLRYGVEGAAGVHVEGGVENIALAIKVKPHLETRAYVQLGLDTKLVVAKVRGALVLLHDKLKNKMNFGIQDGANAAEVHFSLKTSNEVNALDGSVDIVTRAIKKEFTKNLFDWNGVSRSDEFYNFSGPVATLD